MNKETLVVNYGDGSLKQRAFNFNNVIFYIRQRPDDVVFEISNNGDSVVSCFTYDQLKNIGEHISKMVL